MITFTTRSGREFQVYPKGEYEEGELRVLGWYLGEFGTGSPLTQQEGEAYQLRWLTPEERISRRGWLMGGMPGVHPVPVPTAMLTVLSQRFGPLLLAVSAEGEVKTFNTNI